MELKDNQKFTRQQQEDIVQVWRQRLVRSFREKQRHIEQWEIVREMYHFRHYKEVSKQDRVVVGKMFSNIRQMVSALYFQKPTMYARPLTPLGEWTGPIMEQVLGRTRSIIDAEEEERHLLTNALLYSTGILKHGYHSEYASPETPIADPKFPKGKDWATDAGKEGALWEDSVLPQAPLTEYNEGILFEYPWKKSISPFDFFADPEARTYKEARWVAHRFRRPYVDVVRDSRYDKKAREEIVPTGPSTWFNAEGEDFDKWKEGDPNACDAAMVTLWEVYDKTTRYVTTLAENCKVPLTYGPYPFASGPYTILQFFPSDESFWGISYAWTFMTQIQALNKLRSRMLQHFNAWGRTKAVYSRHAGIDANTAKAWAEQPADSVMEIDNPDGLPIDKLFQVSQPVPVPTDAYNLTSIFERDLDETSGISELARGSSQGVQTATEASFMQQQQGLRVADMRYRLERAIVDSDRKIMDILVEFWDSSKVIPMVGPDGANWEYLQVARQILPGGFEIDIEPGSTERIDKNVRNRQAIEMMRELIGLAPLLQAQQFDINWAELVKTMIKNTEIIRNPDRVLFRLNPQPLPGAPAPSSSAQTSQGGAFQLPSPMGVSMTGQAPWESNAGVSGRANSEAMGGRALVGV